MESSLKAVRRPESSRAACNSYTVVWTPDGNPLCWSADSRVVGAIFQFDRSSALQLELGYRMADVKKFPRARGWGLCSGIEQIWEEHVLDGEATLR